MGRDKRKLNFGAAQSPDARKTEVDLTRRNRVLTATSVKSRSVVRATITPSRPMNFSLSSKKAQPRGSFENTKTGTFGPRASAILPASDHFVETTKLGGLLKDRRLAQFAPFKPHPASDREDPTGQSRSVTASPLTIARPRPPRAPPAARTKGTHTGEARHREAELVEPSRPSTRM